MSTKICKACKSLFQPITNWDVIAQQQSLEFVPCENCEQLLAENVRLKLYMDNIHTLLSVVSGSCPSDNGLIKKCREISKQVGIVLKEAKPFVYPEKCRSCVFWRDKCINYLDGCEDHNYDSYQPKGEQEND